MPPSFVQSSSTCASAIHWLGVVQPVIDNSKTSTIPIMKFYAIPATVRVSFAMYNTQQEVDVLMQVIDALSNASKVIGYY